MERVAGKINFALSPDLMNGEWERKVRRAKESRLADFHQNVVPTFTRLVDEDLARMEKGILRAARRAPNGVIIPALFTDFSSPAMQNIIQELIGMNFVKRVYISLDRSSEEEFHQATEIIKPLKERGALLWNDSPSVQAVLDKIAQTVPLGARGKGRAVWTALGYALGKAEVSVLAFHDADILTYDRGFGYHSGVVNKPLLWIGATGTVLAALCCATPLLVVVLSALGLSALTGYLDYVLLPAIAIFVGIVIYALWRRQPA